MLTRQFKLMLAGVTLAGVTMATFTTTHGIAATGPEITDQLVSIGEAVYARECAACHGAQGAGDGPGAHYLNPRPRNFELAVYKIRSTPSGELPTAEDLFTTITNGIESSMMPSFKSLPEQERWAVVEVIRRFGGIEQEEGTPSVVPPRPAAQTNSLQHGREVYDRLDCANCHGDTGMGDGPSSLTLENDARERVWAPDLTTGRYKVGSDPKALYQTIANGLDGSPMPSYASEASSEEIWDLVNFLESLVSDK